MFSTVIWHSATLSSSAPVIFVQYLAGMAVIAGVRAYARGYERVADKVRLKWPNDVYAVTEDGTYVKIGGVLVNSTYSGDAYGLVVGVGVNVANAAPTTGLDAIARSCGIEPFQRETLLARILASFEELYTAFCVEGWGSRMEGIYYDMWLHKYEFE
jgi:biotin---protein ligase